MNPSGARDPFYEVKDRVQSSISSLRVDVTRWESLSPKSPEFLPLTKSIAQQVKSVKLDVKDLAQTIQIVKEHREKFKMIDEREIESRTEFVKDIRGILAAYEQQLKKAKQQTEMESRRQLTSKGGGGGGPSGGSSRFQNAMETESTRAQDEYIADVRSQHQAVEEKQDLVLEDMSAALSRLGNLADDINTELKEQDTMLKDVDDEMASAQDNMNMVLKKLEKLLKSSDKGRLCCIALLFIFALALFIAVIN